MAFAGPELEAEVLGVGAARREHILLGYAGERLGGRLEEKWLIEFWVIWPRPRAVWLSSYNIYSVIGSAFQLVPEDGGLLTVFISWVGRSAGWVVFSQNSELQRACRAVWTDV